jgi:hypothetical protein
MQSRTRLVALIAGMVVLLAFGWFVSSPGTAVADDGSAPSGSQKVVVFGDVTIGPDQVWDNVIVVGGDVAVQGTVNRTLVVVGGNLTVGPNASIGAGVSPDDTAVVSVFGNVSIQVGAVVGRMVDVGGSVPDAARAVFVDPVLRTWRIGPIVSWVLSTVLLLVAAVIASAIAPRQLAVVRDGVRYHFLSSLGWGALGAIIVVPIVTVLLIVTVVGIIVAVPWLAVGLPLMSLFGLAAVAAMIGRFILGFRGDGRENLIAASVVGMAVVSLIRWIPVAGAVIFVLLWFAGFGATCLAICKWLRARRARRSEGLGDADA